MSAYEVDERTGRQYQFAIAVDATTEALLDNEDTNHDIQITIDDSGPKVQDITLSGLNI